MNDTKNTGNYPNCQYGSWCWGIRRKINHAHLRLLHCCQFLITSLFRNDTASRFDSKARSLRPSQHSAQRKFQPRCWKQPQHQQTHTSKRTPCASTPLTHQKQLTTSMTFNNPKKSNFFVLSIILANQEPETCFHCGLLYVGPNHFTICAGYRGCDDWRGGALA